MISATKVHLRKLVTTCLMLWLLLQPVMTVNAGQSSIQPQDQVARQAAQTLLANLTPEERVGQLMLVSFEGTTISEDSAIAQLIRDYHIGGVVLSAGNDNFTSDSSSLSTAWAMIAAMQNLEWQAYADTPPPGTIGSNNNYIPLFVGISQEGDGYPYSEILSGVTQIPNPMAIGATWQPDLATQAGDILGQELSSLGINLLLGPSLDILENPGPDKTGDLATRTFGGDPFWVGEMAGAFIRGVHDGSNNRIAVIGKYFPGRGSSDRPPEEEIATIRKTLEQLKQIELAPFFAVTGDASDSASQVDGLLTSHIRYQGLQGNIRATTRPISFDTQAFEQLISLPAFQTWRSDGGMMVSDSLGSRAVRLFYDPSGLTFNARFVARDALLAGNDLLYLGNFIGSDDPDHFTTVIRTLQFFAQKYVEDPAFAQRVDEAVFRILVTKYKLYPQFAIEQVVPNQEGLLGIGHGQQIAFSIARQAATLISPSEGELDVLQPSPPGLQDRIVFITDSYTIQPCSDCPEETIMPVEALQQAVLRLYGPDAGGQTVRRNLLSFSYENLVTMLDRGINRTELEFHIKNAQWIVISMLDVSEGRPYSDAIRRFLAERPDLLRGKQVVVFAFNAPYYLDATDISKLTAYYGLYSKSPEFIDVAARLLFNELRPITGASPVSIPGVGYDLIEATAPDSTQTIIVQYDSPISGAGINTTPTPQSQSVEYNIGDLIPVRTNLIIDSNGHPVPDNTPVIFSIRTADERRLLLREIQAGTINGFARATIPIEVAGNLLISARSEPAVNTIPYPVNVIGLRPTITVEPTATITQTPGPTPTPTMPVPAAIQVPGPQTNAMLNLAEWAIAVALAGLIGWVTFRMSVYSGWVRWSMRAGLLVVICGLATYFYLVLKLPGSDVLNEAGIWAGALAALLGNSLGIAGIWLWRTTRSS